MTKIQFKGKCRMSLMLWAVLACVAPGDFTVAMVLSVVRALCTGRGGSKHCLKCPSLDLKPLCATNPVFFLHVQRFLLLQRQWFSYYR